MKREQSVYKATRLPKESGAIRYVPHWVRVGVVVVMCALWGVIWIMAFGRGGFVH
jgi:hypothetical protein